MEGGRGHCRRRKSSVARWNVLQIFRKELGRALSAFTPIDAITDGLLTFATCLDAYASTEILAVSAAEAHGAGRGEIAHGAVISAHRPGAFAGNPGIVDSICASEGLSALPAVCTD